MDEHTVSEWEKVSDLAGRMVRNYIQGIIPVEDFAVKLWQEVSHSSAGEVEDSSALGLRARGLCSQILYEACHQENERVRDLAFVRLGEYLERVLLRKLGGPGSCVDRDVQEEIIQKTLIEILRGQACEGSKPTRPRAFLGWASVILHRQLCRHWQQKPRMDLCSLEAQGAEFGAELLDEREPDPLEAMLRLEQREELLAAIGHLRNPRYREVLLETYFRGLEDPELAVRFQVPVKDIYLWRFRALEMLRRQPAILLGSQERRKYA